MTPGANADSLTRAQVRVSVNEYRYTPGHTHPLPVHADQTVAHLIMYIVCKSMLISECKHKPGHIHPLPVRAGQA